MNPDEVIEVFVAGIILVIGGFVIATILSPGLATILNSIVVQLISGLVYLMVIVVIFAMFYQLVKEV